MLWISCLAIYCWPPKRWTTKITLKDRERTDGLGAIFEVMVKDPTLDAEPALQCVRGGVHNTSITDARTLRYHQRRWAHKRRQDPRKKVLIPDFCLGIMLENDPCQIPLGEVPGWSQTLAGHRTADRDENGRKRIVLFKLGKSATSTVKIQMIPNKIPQKLLRNPAISSSSVSINTARCYSRATARFRCVHHLLPLKLHNRRI